MKEQDKFEDYMNNVLAPWVIQVVLGTNFAVFMIVLASLAFGKN